jgi:hypothetical protein
MIGRPENVKSGRKDTFKHLHSTREQTGLIIVKLSVSCRAGPNEVKKRRCILVSYAEILGTGTFLYTYWATVT